MNNNQIDNRIYWIDNCKGIAIIMIVYAHCMTEHYMQSTFHNLISCWFSYFHVSIFFVIAGYLFALKPITNSFSKFLIKKVKRLLVPFWVFSILYWIEMALFKAVSGREWILYLSSNMINLINGKGGGVQWFISVFFIANIALFVVNKINNKIVKVIIFLALLLIGLYDIKLYEVFRKSFIAVGFMSVGYYFNIYKNTEHLIIIVIVGVISHIIGIFYNGQIGLAGLNFGKSEILYFVLSIIVCLGIMSMFMLYSKRVNILSYFGRNSMIVLCTHVHIIEIIWLINNKLLHISWLEGAALAIATMIIEIPTIYVFKKYLPKLVGIW